jgi:hypothetical protein
MWYNHGLWFGWQALDSWQGQEIYLYSVLSRLALVPTQSSVQWISGALSPRLKWLGHETDHSPAYSAEVKNGGATPPLTYTP